MSTNLNTFINDTDMLNENIQAQADTDANAGGVVQGNESNPAGDAQTEQKNGQVNNKATSDATSLKEVTGKEREELTKEEEMDVKSGISTILDVATMLSGIVTRPDGKLVDFSDKEGRELLRDAVLAFKTQMQNAINDACLENKEYAEAIANAIPKKIDAELVKEDRNRIDWLRRFWNRCILALLVIVLFACGTFYFNGKKVGEVKALSAELERWYVTNQNAINFGNYMKEYNLKTYEYWHSGRWKRDKALRDSVNKANKMRGWKE